MKLKVGDRVIALTNPKNERCQSRVKGNLYIVQAVSYCSGCGKQRINIGQRTSSSSDVKCNCGTCQPSNGLFWTATRHFALLKEQTLEQLIESEEFELACVVRDNLKGSS